MIDKPSFHEVNNEVNPLTHRPFIAGIIVFLCTRHEIFSPKGAATINGKPLHRLGGETVCVSILYYYVEYVELTMIKRVEQPWKMMLRF